MGLAVHGPGEDLGKALRDAIDSGAITTWKYKSVGDYFRYFHSGTDEQWDAEAYFSLASAGNWSVFSFIPTPKKMTDRKDDVRGVYHGRLAQTLIANLPNLVYSIEIKFASGKCPQENPKKAP